ncbi:MAG: hypothetical protein KDD84_15695 [Caldilineaceae bacterium]|nr:hypothetical protein [Caldilineaceae bacterium]
MLCPKNEPNPRHRQHPQRQRPIPRRNVPLFIPNLDEIRALAMRLHKDGQPYRGRAWGWEVTYEPEVTEPVAQVEVADGKGGFVTETMPLWMAASFTIGESGVWFFSLLWENGVDQPPVEFLDDRNVIDG